VSRTADYRAVRDAVVGGDRDRARQAAEVRLRPATASLIHAIHDLEEAQ